MGFTRPVILLATLASTLSLATPGCRPRTPATVQPVRVAVLSVGSAGHGIIGPVINREALQDATDELSDASPDIIVLRFDSPGGMVAAVPDLSDLVHYELEPRYRVVAWVHRAASAAALVALTCDEIALTPDGILGGIVTYEADDNGTVRPIADHDLAVMLDIGREVAERGGYDPLIVQAMQQPTGLSREDDHWRGDDGGPVVLCPRGEILVLNAVTATDATISLGEASDLPQLMALLEVSNWEPVGSDVDERLQARLAAADTALERATQLAPIEGPKTSEELGAIAQQYPWVARYLGLPSPEGAVTDFEGAEEHDDAHHVPD